MRRAHKFQLAAVAEAQDRGLRRGRRLTGSISTWKVAGASLCLLHTQIITYTYACVTFYKQSLLCKARVRILRVRRCLHLCFRCLALQIMHNKAK
jgi:hypothetical protein